MKTTLWSLVLGFTFVNSALVSSATADDPKLSLAVPPDPNKGPDQQYLYKNVDGFMVIGATNNNGSAKYTWNGVKNNDVLKYSLRRTVEDGSWGTAKTAAVWQYEATDSTGGKWYLFFGEDPLQGITGPGGEKLYPIYYTFDDPAKPTAIIKRWLTSGGTTRS